MPPGDPGEDRRARGTGRRTADRQQVFRSVLAAVLALCGALSILYFVLAALGAVDLGEAAVASIIALVLGALWIAGYWQRSRSGSKQATQGDRERRGF